MYLLVSPVKEQGFRPLGPTSNNNLPLILIHRVRRKNPGPGNSPEPRGGFSCQQSGPGEAKVRKLRACRWSIGEWGFRGDSEQSPPTRLPGVGGWWEGRRMRPGWSPPGVESRPRAVAPQLGPAPIPAPAPLLGLSTGPQTEHGYSAGIAHLSEAPGHPAFSSRATANPQPKIPGQGSLTSRHFPTSPPLPAGREKLKVTPYLGRRPRVLGPSSRQSPHLAAAHDVGVLRQQIHHLPFAFVAPLRAEHHRYPVPSRARPGTAAVAVGQRGCRRVGLSERHGSRDARRARTRPEATSAQTELLCGRQPHAEEEGARGGPAPAPAGPPPSRQAPPRSLPQPAQAGTMTAPRRPAWAAPPLERGPGGGNRRHPDRSHAPSAAWRATLLQTRRAEGAGAGLRACVRLRAPPTRPSSCFSN